MFRRKVYDDLLRWKKESNGRTAILLEGPRRVGKTTLVTEFARNEYRSSIIVDFNDVDDEVKKLFVRNRGHINRFLLELQQMFGGSSSIRARA